MAGYSGDGFSAVNAQLNFPAGLAVDRFGALYIADSQNERVRRIAGGIISTYLGVSPNTPLSTPVAIAVDVAGTLYVANNGLVHSYTAAGAWTNVVVTAQTNAPHAIWRWT